MHPSVRNCARRGSILAVSFGVVVIVAALLAISSERAMGVTRMENLAAARQRAVYAAEGVAAMLEVRLVNLAANNDLAGLDLEPNPNFGIQWFGDCLVRWRIEPVMARSDPTRPVTDLGSAYTVNPVADTNILPPTGSYVNNYEFYTYRIATEAFLLADPANLAGFNAANPSDLTAAGAANPAAPWNDQRQRVCALQSQRVVQLKLNSLFKYAIFYAATGNTGDLEFWVGTSIAVQGAVHSNGAIYIGGQGNQYISGNYHDSASNGGGVRIGTAGQRVTITGIDGIYRMRKGGNVLAVRNATHPLFSAVAAATPGFVPNPLAIPRDASTLNDNGVMTGNANLNGDNPGSGNHSFNGTGFTSANDSRAPTWVTASPFGQYVRDDQKGATVVRTLSNIPELAGRPFEHQRLVGAGQLLYDKDGDPTTTDFTIAPTSTSRQVYYTAAPVAANPAWTTAVTAWPISAENMLLYRNITTGDRDVHPTGALPVIDAAFACSNLPAGTGVAPGYYLDLATNGDGTTAGVAGLVFRERYTQDSSAFSGRIPFRSDAAYTSDALYRAAYTRYMVSQYQVLLGGRDITADFFTQGIANVAPATISTTAFIASEESFVNMREATAMDHFYSPLASNFTRNTSMPIVLPTPLNNAAYKVNVLNLNLRAIQDYLKTRTWNDATGLTLGSAGELARAHFNGLVYAHRTRRSRTYDPINYPQYRLNPNSTGNTYEWSALGAANHPHLQREGNGPIETFHGAIRVANAADINWNHSGAAAAPLGTSGLTIVTPNHCYMWGDFNTTTHVDAAGTPRITPCAVFADGVTALSNSWADSAHTTAATGMTAGSATTYVLSYVINNVPTDDVNAIDEGSGAVSNVVRFLENWAGNTYTFQGSLVVMNQSRYTYTTLGANPSAGSANMNTTFYSPPSRVLTFNSDLLSRAGQPPYTPFGVQIIRTVSTIIDLQ